MFTEQNEQVAAASWKGSHAIEQTQPCMLRGICPGPPSHLPLQCQWTIHGLSTAEAETLRPLLSDE